MAFKQAPNFEQQASYTVSVSVSDGALSATVTTTVAVSNVDEAGTVALNSTQPQVGTAADGDAVGPGRQPHWRGVAVAAVGPRLPRIGRMGPLGPKARRGWPRCPVTRRRRAMWAPGCKRSCAIAMATVRMRPRPRRRRGAATEAVVGPPEVVASLTGVPGDRQVVLTWQAPASDGGSPISGYEYRQSADGGTNWQPDWTAIANSNAKTTGHTVTDLTNGMAYTFEVRAVNAVGVGAARAVTATPVSPNRPPTLTGPRGGDHSRT